MWISGTGLVTKSRARVYALEEISNRLRANFEHKRTSMKGRRSVRLSKIWPLRNPYQIDRSWNAYAGHDQYKAWASLLKTDYGLYIMVGGSHTETSIEFKKGAVGCRVSRKR